MKKTEHGDFFQTMNLQLESDFKDSTKLNFCRFLRPEKNGQISIVAKYAPCVSVEEGADGRPEFTTEPFLTLAPCAESPEGLKEVESRDYSAYYYGISPAIDETRIVEAIADGMLKDEEGLRRFIADHASGFMLRQSQAGDLLPCAKLFVLSIAHNFGIKLTVNKAQCQHLRCFFGTTLVEMKEMDRKRLLGEAPMEKKCLLSGFWKKLTPSKSTKEETAELLLCGSPTEALFCALDRYTLTKDEDGVHWTLSEEKDGLSARDVFRDRKNLILLYGHTFYSGALLRMLYIDTRLQSYGNDTVVPLQFLFERSSYGTVFTLDHNYLQHPLLESCREKLTEMYRKDDLHRLALREAMPVGGSRGDYLSAVNRYLKHSVNVNQMGVTGNLLTKDGILLVGERDATSIDSGEIYPSVNGNAEVIDPNVMFYKLYANEDYPTIDLSGNRIDFSGELNRETYAELSVITKSPAWECYGFTISGITPHKNEAGKVLASKRRMHFNILCEQSCDHTFEEVLNKQKKSTEAFENRSLKGLHPAYYPNLFARLWAKLLSGIRLILNSESHIGQITALYVFLATIIAAVQSGSLTSLTFTMEDIAKVVFSLLSVLMVCVVGCRAVKSYLFRRKYITKIHFAGNRIRNAKAPFLRITKYFKKNPSHPVAYAAVMAHVLKISQYK